MSRLEELKRKAAEMTAEIERLETAKSIASDPADAKRLRIDARENRKYAYAEVCKAVETFIASVPDTNPRIGYLHDGNKYDDLPLWYVEDESWTKTRIHGFASIPRARAYHKPYFIGTKAECEAWLNSPSNFAFDVVDEG